MKKGASRRVLLLIPTTSSRVIPDRPSAGSILERSGGNQGNYLFVEALRRHFEPVLELNWGEVRYRFDLIEAAEPDVVVVAAANQLGPHVDLGGLAEVLTELDMPTWVIGLGAQHDSLDSAVGLTTGTMRFLETVWALRPYGCEANIYTRGAWSTKVLESRGFGSVPFGCPSQFLSFDPGLYESARRAAEHSESVGVSCLGVAAGHTGWPTARQVERDLLEWLSGLNSGLYIVQSDEALMGMALREPLPVETKERLFDYLSFGRMIDGRVIERILARHAVVPESAQDWLTTIKACDLVVGSRVHGVMAGLQSGIPSVLVATDARSLELGLTCGMPTVTLAQWPSLNQDDVVRLAHDGLDNWEESRSVNAQVYAHVFEHMGMNVPTAVALSATRERVQQSTSTTSWFTGTDCVLDGRLESQSAESVSGWAICRKHPQERVVVAVSQGAQSRALYGVASQWRRDLMEAELRRGDCAFSIKLDDGSKVESVGFLSDDLLPKLTRTPPGSMSVKWKSSDRLPEMWWRHTDAHQEGWEQRARMVAEQIPKGATVMEYGSGRGHLGKYLDPTCHWIPSDLRPDEPEYLDIDLNDPDLEMHSPRQSDYWVAIGVLEYVHDPFRAIRWMSSIGGVGILTYSAHTPGALQHSRHFQGWQSDATEYDFVEWFSALGLKIRCQVILDKRAMWSQFLWIVEPGHEG